MAVEGIAVVGAPLDLGAGGRRGVDMGPSAIRYAGLGRRIDDLGLLCRDRGNVEAPLRETAEPGETNARFLDAIRKTCEQVALRVGEAAAEGLDEFADWGQKRLPGRPPVDFVGFRVSIEYLVYGSTKSFIGLGGGKTEVEYGVGSARNNVLSTGT